LVSALLGAADRDHDGQVSLDEAFTYAADHTVAATVSSLEGPQHPTYCVDLAGQRDVVLTRPGAAASTGTIELAEPGTWLVQRGDDSGQVVAEIVADEAGRRISLEAGRYTITKRQPSRVLQGTLVVTAGERRAIDGRELHPVEYARVVRKGGSDRRLAWSVFALGGVRGELLDLGTPWRVRAGARVDTATLSFELRATAGSSDATNPRHTTITDETSLEVAATKVTDRGPLALGMGLLVGAGVLRQRFVDPALQPTTIAPEPSRTSAFELFAPLVTCDVATSARSYVRLEASAPTYLLREPSTTAHLTWDLGAGVGLFF
jgi:hypothetical protein